MAGNESTTDPKHLKLAWVIYSIVVAVVVAIMVFVVANDNEEMFFYGLMTTAVSYVFRPTDKFFNKHIARFTGPAE